MKKLKWFELTLLVLAAVGIVFTAGIIVGRHSGGTRITVTEPGTRSISPEETDTNSDNGIPSLPLLSDGEEAETKPVNLNTAGEEELAALPGIGPKLAQAIISYREEHGGFTVPAELMNVSGIGEGKYEKLKDLVCVE